MSIFLESAEGEREVTPKELGDVLVSLKATQQIKARNPATLITVTKDANDGFSLRMTSSRRFLGMKTDLVSKRSLSMKNVEKTLLSVAKGDNNWMANVEWEHASERSPAHQSVGAGIVALVVFGIAYALVGIYAWITRPPGWDLKTFTLGWPVIIGVAIYIGWNNLYFGAIRRAQARWLGDRLGGTVVETTNSPGLVAGTLMGGRYSPTLDWEFIPRPGASREATRRAHTVVAVTDLLSKVTGGILAFIAIFGLVYLVLWFLV
jgi:hypothetical protein